MTEFYVDAAGLNSVYNQLVRASGDASDTLEYTRKHCDLGFTDVGLIMRLISPHKHAYGEVTEALTQLKELAQGAGTQVNAAQHDYARTDQAAAARLDAGYPGAKDPAAVRGSLTQGRPDLQGYRSAFTDVAQPGSHLKNPEYAIGIEMWSINPMADLISPSAWLRQVSIWLFSYDPFEGWASQFSGDWKAYVHCGNAMGLAGAAAHDIGRNLVAGATDVSTVWRGKAAEAEQEFQLTLGAAAINLQSACRQYNELYMQAAEAVKKLFDVVSGLISDLLDVLIIINAAAAVGTATIETVVGPIAGYGVAAYYTWQAYDLYKEISSLYGNAEDLLKLIGGSITGIKATLAVKDLPTVQPYHHPAGY
ncbi:hypothetical protein [Actinoplanes friuliensis]|uniref:Uncharacterized protein n=1 Tax=Actinoplanes friuliensis DSM 7358 TaxID=1246995 RepID=U5VVG4_9ACTN|nr:hypothetical protein [Actinoplanes friuliensis]AGZ39611.1 hypothetical protein AFR_06610 [Actinoplanes friuliensis DSM 7358]